VSGSDYNAILNGTLSFAPGEKTKYINVVVKNDNVIEPTESFQVILKLPINATLASTSGAKAISNVRILNSTVATTASVLEGTHSGLIVRALPNPSGNEFQVTFTGDGSKPVTLRVTDITGRLLLNQSGIRVNSSLNIGAGWKQGTYIAEIIQGTEKQMIRLVKQ
jgi:hypothetical protein